MGENSPTFDQAPKDEVVKITPIPTEAMHAVAAWVQKEYAAALAQARENIAVFESVSADTDAVHSDDVQADIANAKARFDRVEQILRTLRTSKVINVIDNSSGLTFATDGAVETKLPPNQFSLDSKTADALVGALRHTLLTPIMGNPLQSYKYSTEGKISDLGKKINQDSVQFGQILGKLNPPDKHLRKELQISVGENEHVSIDVISEIDPDEVAAKEYPLVKVTPSHT